MHQNDKQNNETSKGKQAASASTALQPLPGTLNLWLTEPHTIETVQFPLQPHKLDSLYCNV